MQQQVPVFGKHSDGTWPTVLDEGWLDARTAYLDADLTPATTFALWVNRDDTQDAVDLGGDPVAPWVLSFRTAE